MKKYLICILLVLLCGCSSNSSLDESLDSLLNNVDSISTNRPNNTLVYYSYYLPSDMGQEDGDDCVILSFLDSKIIMSLNVKEIINNKYYQSSYMQGSALFNQDYLIYTKQDSYSTLSNQSKDYIYRLYKINESYVIELETSDLSFLAYGDSNIKDLSRHLFIIAKSVNVDTDLVISAYSSKSVVDYQKKQIDLFDSIKPTTGSLSDLLTNDAIIGDSNQDAEPENTEESDATENTTEDISANEETNSNEE